MSRKHARLVLSDGTATLIDLGSSNGTFIDGVRLMSGESRVLGEGDKIRIGQISIFKFTRYDKMEEHVQRQLLESALRDSVTHTFNRRYFVDRLAREVGFAQREVKPLVLLLVDVSRLRDIRTKLGAEAAETLLKRMSGILTRIIRAEDVLARSGTEEFAILSHGITESQGMLFADRLRKLVVGQELEYRQAPLHVEISIGVSAYPFETTEKQAATLAGTLIERAEAAVARAKKAGRNQISC